MITDKEIKEEFERAGFGPVVLLKEFSEKIGVSRELIYMYAKKGSIVKTSKGVLSRDSLIAFLRQREDFFCNLYKNNRAAAKAEESGVTA